MILTINVFLNKKPKELYTTYLVKTLKLNPEVADMLTASESGDTITVKLKKWYENIFTPGRIIIFNKNPIREFKVTTREYSIIKNYTGYRHYNQLRPLIEQLKLEAESSTLDQDIENALSVGNYKRTNKSTS